MALRVRLIEPRPPGHTVYEHVLLPRLGLPLMATLLAAAGHDATVQCEMLAPLDLAELERADLVGISATTATQPAAYAIADDLVAAGVPVVLGGPHVTFCAEEALEHAPLVVRGEGQETILELVAALEQEGSLDRLRASGSLDTIAGVSWRSLDGHARHAPDRARCSQQAFEDLPSPDLTLIQGYERMRVKPVMTQWGCPFDCDFCSVTAQFSRKVRYRRTEQVIAELATLGPGEVFFYDDNFVVNKRRTRELLEAMIAAGLTPRFSAQVRADMVLRSRTRGDIDHDFLALLRRAGCQTVMVGFESASDENLAQIGKRSTVADSEQAVRAFHEHGIGVHGMFVVGLDGDDAESAQGIVDFARRLGIDTMQLMMITPAPGTRFFERIAAEDRLIETDWALFDGHHAVLRPLRMTPLELQTTTLEALASFYSRSAIVTSAVSGLAHQLVPLIGSIARRAGRPAVRRHVEDALWVSALRLYGRRQIALQGVQQRTLDHIAHLAGLTP
jgi:radical SAM superfamily enzyme YgiQ (UPF0313 family)